MFQLPDNKFAQIDSVYQGLLGLLPTMEDVRERVRCARIDTDSSQFFSEYRTVGFKLTRQCGQTAWLHRTVISQEDTHLITQNNDYRKHAIDKGVPPSRVSVIGKQTPEDLVGVRTVFVDDAKFTLKNYQKEADFYQWLAEFNNPNVLVVLVG